MNGEDTEHKGKLTSSQKIAFEAISGAIRKRSPQNNSMWMQEK